MANPFDPLFKKPFSLPVLQAVGEVPDLYAEVAARNSVQRYSFHPGYLTDNHNRSMSRGSEGSRRHHYPQNGNR
jgi:hypothetical protein